jgi:AraC-like DNA-binding protein
MEDITTEQRNLLRAGLADSGIELMEDKKSVLIEKIKSAVIDMVHHPDEVMKMKFSVFISEKLKYDYTYLSNLFTEVHGTSIAQFIIAHKVERVKELIIYDEMNITEIAYLMNYSSVAHLSNQFKKETGLTPSQFKKLKQKYRVPIEEVGELK